MIEDYKKHPQDWYDILYTGNESSVTAPQEIHQRILESRQTVIDVIQEWVHTIPTETKHTE